MIKKFIKKFQFGAKFPKTVNTDNAIAYNNPNPQNMVTPTGKAVAKVPAGANRPLPKVVKPIPGDKPLTFNNGVTMSRQQFVNSNLAPSGGKQPTQVNTNFLGDRTQVTQGATRNGVPSINISGGGVYTSGGNIKALINRFKTANPNYKGYVYFNGRKVYIP